MTRHKRPESRSLTAGAVHVSPDASTARLVLRGIHLVVALVACSTICGCAVESRRPHGGPDLDSVRAYFEDLPLGMPVERIEKDLGLPKPAKTEAPASISVSPFWKYRYFANGLVLFFEADHVGDDPFGPAYYMGNWDVIREVEYWDSIGRLVRGAHAAAAQGDASGPESQPLLVFYSISGPRSIGPLYSLAITTNAQRARKLRTSPWGSAMDVYLVDDEVGKLIIAELKKRRFFSRAYEPPKCILAGATLISLEVTAAGFSHSLEAYYGRDGDQEVQRELMALLPVLHHTATTSGVLVR